MLLCYMVCSTVGQAVARRLACPLFDGDDFHPPSNIGAVWLAALQASLLLFYVVGQGDLVLSSFNGSFLCACNSAKMKSGIPLSDEDRWPWLGSLAQLIQQHVAR